MLQDEIFSKSEGNAWFKRNKDVLLAESREDWPVHLLSSLRPPYSISSVCELGCANGWRLHRLSRKLGSDVSLFGVDASSEAIEDGRRRFPELHLQCAALSNVPLQRQCDIVIVNYVLHWVDRNTLLKSIAEIDRLLGEGGFLIVGDFLPDVPCRRKYHHLADEQVFTYKQDYPRLFEALGTYKEIARTTYDHDKNGELEELIYASSRSRGVCSVLRKSLQDYYSEQA